MIYKKIVRPILFRLTREDPEIAHRMAIAVLKHLGCNKFFRSKIGRTTLVNNPALRQKVFGLQFANPVGLAAGFDKNAEAISGLDSLGFGSITVGTITASEQTGNNLPRIFRLPKDRALINRMGFNNHGADKIALRLLAQRQEFSPTPIGVSLGKSKTISLDEVADDYIYSLRRVYAFGDYFEINISSSNTAGLRTLQRKEYLNNLLERINEETLRLGLSGGGGIKPLFVKISPDIEGGVLNDLLDVCIQQRISGIIAVNTTIGRDGLKTRIDEDGGLSGRPLFERSLGIVKRIQQYAYGRMPVIASGGIFTAEDVYEMLKAGASLIQVLTGLVYEGPFIARNINRGLVKIFKREGIKNISDLNGNKSDNSRKGCYIVRHPGCRKAI